MKNRTFLCFLVFILGYFILPLTTTHAAWYDADWPYRLKITVQSSKVDSTQTNVPILIDLDNVPDSFFNEVKNDGADIVMTSDDEVTIIPHELVSIDPVAKTGELYAKVPIVDGATDTDFYLYYGNVAANDSSNSGSVWSDYEAVWHFNENVSQLAFEGLGVVTQAGVNDTDGSWAVLYGKNPDNEQPINENLNLAVDEDQINDAERSTGPNSVGYWVFDTDQAVDIQDSGGEIIGEIGIAENVGGVDKVVNLNNNYTDPIIVTVPILESATDVPAVVRMHSVLSDEFTLYLQNPGDGAMPNSSDIHYIVIESGDHALPGGIDLEAGSVNVTGRNGRFVNWSETEQVQITPTNTYTQPVVLGQIMTANDALWQTFWSSTTNRYQPPTNASLYVGRHVGEEPLASSARVAEEVGYIIIEEGTGMTNGTTWVAALGSDDIEGVGESPPYAYDAVLTGNGAPSLFFEDSTSNNNDAYLNDTVAGQAEGKVYRSVSIGAPNARLPIANMTYNNVNNLDLAVSFWLKTTDTVGGILSFDALRQWSVGLNEHGAAGENGRLSFNTASNNNGATQLNSSSTVNDGAWNYVATVFDSGSVTDKNIYLNGGSDTSADQHTNGLGNLSNRYGFMGDTSEATSFNGTAGDLFYTGELDEMRVRDSAVSEDWVSLMYENQNDNLNFLSFTAESLNAAPSSPITPYFNHTSAQAGLTNPIHVTVGGDDSRTAYFSAIYEDPDSGDIANEARVQVSTDPTFAAITHWDSGWDSITDVAEGNRSQDIEYDNFGNAATLSLAMDDGAVTYYWRIAFKDDEGEEGAFSDNQTFALLDTPAAPSGLSASKNEGNPDTFSLSWNDNSTNEDEFEVEVSEDGGGFSGIADSPFVADATMANDTTTQDNASYQYRVRACNYAGCSAYDTDATTYYTDPNMPTNVYGDYVNDGEFTVNFTDQSVIEEVRVERCVGLTDCEADTYTLVQANVATTQGVPQTLTDDNASIVANETFRWRVRADNGSETSQYTVSPYEYTTPADPSDFQGVYVSDTSIDLTWTDNSAHEDGFRLQVSEEGGGFTEITPGVNTVGANVTTYTYTGASVNKTYDFKIQAHVGATVNNGELLSSEVDSAATVYTSPAAITGLTQDYLADDQIELAWTDNATHETGYNIYVEENGAGSALETTLAADAQSYTYAGGNNESNYKFIVEPVISANAPYNSADLTTPSAQTGEVYTSPDTPGFAFSSATETTIEWAVTDNSAIEDGFNLYESDGSTLVQAYAIADLANINEGSLTPNTEYERRLAAYAQNPNTVSNTPAISSVSGLATGLTLANPPTNLQTDTTGLPEGSVKLTWGANTNPAGTEFFAENTNTGANSGWVTILEWQTAGLTCGVNYVLEVTARNQDLTQTVSIPVNFSYDCPVEDTKPSSSGGGGGGGYAPETFDALFNPSPSRSENSNESISSQGAASSKGASSENQVDFPCQVPLADIQGGPYELYIGQLYCAEKIDGFPDGFFRSDIPVNRVGFLKMLLGVFDFPVSERVILRPGQRPFPDAPVQSWFAPYVYAGLNEVITGYGDGLFRPDQTVTKAEALTMLLRIDGYPVQPVDLSGPWYVPYIEEGERRGMFTGFIEPNRFITRGEAAQILAMNLLRRQESQVGLVWGLDD